MEFKSSLHVTFLWKEQNLLIKHTFKNLKTCLSHTILQNTILSKALVLNCRLEMFEIYALNWVSAPYWCQKYREVGMKLQFYLQSCDIYILWFLCLSISSTFNFRVWQFWWHHLFQSNWRSWKGTNLKQEPH